MSWRDAHEPHRGIAGRQSLEASEGLDWRLVYYDGVRLVEKEEWVDLHEHEDTEDLVLKTLQTLVGLVECETKE